ncbi:MAG: SoxR reducing system RseC family protein [Comamonadaceae bacterium]|nr:SoxR reducing system RseC family protein [Comamonadaceae bacterium]
MNTPHPADDSLIEGLARVVAVDRDQVWLVAEQPAACGSCATRSACGGGSTTKSAARWRAPRSLGRGQVQLGLGDTVHIGVDRAALTRASLTAYTLPLVAMLMSASSAQGAGDGVAIAAALAGLLAGVVVARVLARRWRDALEPMVLGRATSLAAVSCAPPDMAAPRKIAIPAVHQRSL